ncbi:MAG: hypothetical protein GYA52_10995 [Chloroflexi bacterium]|nr:hypothetical protein [Chloroflexota bacterium]
MDDLGLPCCYFQTAHQFAINTAEEENFEEFMVKELAAGRLKEVCGRVQLDEAFFNIDREQLEQYDSAFPHREKKVTDTQLKRG